MAERRGMTGFELAPGDRLDRRLEAIARRDAARLLVDAATWRCLCGWADATEGEVSGMALVEPAGDDLRLARPFLLAQAANAVETEIEPSALAGLVLDLLEAGVDPATLRVWWHSHGRETAFWSGLDERTIESFGPQAMVSLVIDRGGHRLARLDSFGPRRTTWLETTLVDAAAGVGAASGAAAVEVARVVRPLGGDASLRHGGGHR